MISKSAVNVIPRGIPLLASTEPKIYNIIETVQSVLILTREDLLHIVNSSASRCMLWLANGAKRNIIMKPKKFKRINKGVLKIGSISFRKIISCIIEKQRQVAKLFA